VSILLQPQLFPFDEFADLDDDNSRLALVLWTLPDARLLAVDPIVKTKKPVGLR
jgi:hypothetical protein